MDLSSFNDTMIKQRNSEENEGFSMKCGEKLEFTDFY